MQHAFSIATLWFALALLATFLAARLKVSIALMEILIGILAAAVIGHYFGIDAMGSDLPWLKFLAGTGAVMLTFLAGAELEPAVMRKKWKEVTLIGAVGFIGPFLGCTAIAHYILGLGVAGELAWWNCLIHNLHGGRLRGDARNRIQPHKFWERGAGSVLRQ